VEEVLLTSVKSFMGQAYRSVLVSSIKVAISKRSKIGLTSFQGSVEATIDNIIPFLYAILSNYDFKNRNCR
jgi:hypothetical protein